MATSKREINDRMARLGALVEKKLKDGTVTERFMDGVEAEYARLQQQLRTVNKAQSMSHYADFSTPAPGGREAGSLDDGRRLSFKGLAAPLARKILVDDGTGVKTLAPSGAAVVDQSFRADPIALGKVATGLLDVLPVVPQPTGSFAYLRQTTRTNNAAVVADYAAKPTSSYGVTRVEQSLAVIAHLSEGVPRYWFLDNDSLQAFVGNELAYGLNLAVEAKVFADIAAVSGKQTQAFATSPLATIRKAITKLELAGWEPAALVLHPSDWEGVELALASTSAVEYRGLPYDPATRRLFGIPVVTTPSATAGTAHTLAAEAVVLNTDNTGIGVQWSETSNATDFAENLLRARCEGRFATSIYRPGGIVVTALTNAGS